MIAAAWTWGDFGAAFDGVEFVAADAVKGETPTFDFVEGVIATVVVKPEGEKDTDNDEAKYECSKSEVHGKQGNVSQKSENAKAESELKNAIEPQRPRDTEFKQDTRNQGNGSLRIAVE